MGRAAFAGGHTRNHLRTISQRLFGVERAGIAGHALGYDFGVFVYENAHPNS